jgi:hypothetical protein
MITKPGRLFVITLALLLSACGGMPATEAPVATEGPVATEAPQFTPGPPLASMDLIDTVLRTDNSGSIAYNAPETVKRGETIKIQLLLSPTKSPEELQQQIVESGQVVSATIEITPLMKAVLRPADSEAFVIQDLHDAAVQLILTGEPTEWKWAVTAKKPGEQIIILSLYRLVKYDGQDYWRLVNTYESHIIVTVTIGQRLQMIDWKWLVGILLTLLSIPALWGIFKKNKTESVPQAKGKQ